MDLEDWREAVGAFQRCVSDTADHHEGFIYRHLGNNVLALSAIPRRMSTMASRRFTRGSNCVRRSRP
jgi:hypothetical protein